MTASRIPIVMAVSALANSTKRTPEKEQSIPMHSEEHGNYSVQLAVPASDAAHFISGETPTLSSTPNAYLPESLVSRLNSTTSKRN